MAAVFYFFRDHRRGRSEVQHGPLETGGGAGLILEDWRYPFNADPFFQRRQFGFAVEAPFVRISGICLRHFLSVNEHVAVLPRNSSHGFRSSEPHTPSLHLCQPIQRAVATTQLTGLKHSLFLRHSHEGSFILGPTTLTGRRYSPPYRRLTRQPGGPTRAFFGMTSLLPV